MFGPSEIAQAQSFRDQALIAMENARLFRETREALERQTATADILKVIAGSPTDVQPVFDAIASSANTLIGGFSATVLRYAGETLHLAAFTPTNPTADEALVASFPRPLAEFPPVKLTCDGRTAAFADTESEGVPAWNRDLARLRGYRSMLFTPLMSNGGPIGMISVTRKEPGPFAPHHVQLLRTFADQAVIAIDNVRLFDKVQARTRDLTEALQQQTATAAVLKVISRSAFDLQPVLDTLVETAARLCDAEMALILHRDGEVYRAGASVGFSREYAEFLQSHPISVNRGTVTGRAVLEKRTVQIADVTVDPEYTLTEASTLAGQRTAFGVPLIRTGEVIGVSVLARRRVEPFTQRQIELVTTFADQAVIAINNISLFTETQEALQQQTATADVMKVISRSAFDLQSVLDTLVRSAKELCGAASGVIYLQEGEAFHLKAELGPE